MVAPASTDRWIKFLRMYGPCATNDNMYDETIQHALKRLDITPLVLPAPFLEEILANFSSSSPVSQIITGTAGDGKTYRCRQVWLHLGGNEQEWMRGQKKVVSLHRGGHEIIFIKDLSELLERESTPLLKKIAADVSSPTSSRSYLIAANHGQLLEKLKSCADDPAVARMLSAVEEMLFRKQEADGLRLRLLNLSRARATLLIGEIIEQVGQHPGWEGCQSCPLMQGENRCPIRENRQRLLGESDNKLLRTRLEALIEICAQNDVHLPVRQLLILITNALLGHPAARDGLMTCDDAKRFVQDGQVADASIYRNLFGDNLSRRRAEQTDVFVKLNAFGIGHETSNAADNLLVYGSDDPELQKPFAELVGADQFYGATPTYIRYQQDYLEGYDDSARARFLKVLQAQRQRLFFTMPERYAAELDLWDLTVFRYAGLFLRAVTQVHGKQPLDRRVMSLVMRGLNRLSTGNLVQNSDELVLATSGSLSQSKQSPLLDEIISVVKRQGEEVSLVPLDDFKTAIRVKVARQDPGPVDLELTPTRFEFLGRVAEGALPSSFSLECQEDLLAFKARLLAATARRRQLDGDDEEEEGEVSLRFIELASDGKANQRRVIVRL